MKVLITGAAGFLGSALVKEAVSRGWTVRALTRNAASRAWGSDVEVFEGDLCDPAVARAAVSGVDAVIHAAARVSTSGSWEEFAEVNVRATGRLLEQARLDGGKRFVHISSLSVFDVPADGAVIADSSPYEKETRARGHYSRSKLAADRLVLWEASQGAQAVVLRPGLLFGPGKRPPLARQFVRWKQWYFLLARPDYPLPLSHIESVARAAALALSCGGHVVGKAYTVVDAHVPQAAMVEVHRRATGASWHPVYLPVRVAAQAARVAERVFAAAGKRSPITYHQVCRATFQAFYDCAAAERDLGWRPRENWQRDVEEAIASMAGNG